MRRALVVASLALGAWGQAVAPPNAPAEFSRTPGNAIRLQYDGGAILLGQISASNLIASTEVAHGDHGAVLEIIRLRTANPGGVHVLADVTAGPQAFAAETFGPQQLAFPLVRTSSGPDFNRRNNAIYDRGRDWLLQFPPGTRIEPEASDAAHTRFRVSDGGGELRILFKPRFYQKHRNLPFFRPWTYRVWPDSVAGWSSWWAYRDGVTETDVRAVAGLFARRLEDYGYRYIQLDDGYHPRDGYPSDWLRTNAKFPSGLAGLAQWERAQGLEPAIWENVAVEDAALAQSHPDWFLHGDGSSPLHAPWVGYGLDGSNAQALAALVRPLYRSLHAMGYSYVKIDTLRHLLYDAGYPSRAQLAARGSSPELALRGLLQAAREELGPTVYLLACWGVLPETAGLADGERLGTDGFGPATLQQYNSFNNVVWRNDPDHVDIGGAGEDVIRPVLVSMAGAQLLLSDPVAVYRQPGKLEGARRSAPVLFTRPGQLYDYDPSATNNLTRGLRNRDGGAEPGPIDAVRTGPVCPWWLMDINRSFGRWSVLARLGWQPLPAARVRFADLGLDRSATYLVFEFWTHRFLGAFRDSFKAPPQPGPGARVYAIRPELSRPQILSTSRHITQGGVDLQGVEWDAASGTLSGRSLVVAGDAYTIDLHVPPGYRLSRAELDGLPAEVRTQPDELAATLRPQRSGAIRWQFRFTRRDIKPH